MTYESIGQFLVSERQLALHRPARFFHFALQNAQHGLHLPLQPGDLALVRLRCAHTVLFLCFANSISSICTSGRRSTEPLGGLQVLLARQVRPEYRLLRKQLVARLAIQLGLALNLPPRHLALRPALVEFRRLVVQQRLQIQQRLRAVQERPQVVRQLIQISVCEN